MSGPGPTVYSHKVMVLLSYGDHELHCLAESYACVIVELVNVLNTNSGPIVCHKSMSFKDDRTEI